MDRRYAKTVLKAIKRCLEDVFWEAYGVSIAKPVLPNRPGGFLFICKGNVCRSPFAEYYARTRSKDSSVVFMSAGMHVSTANPAPEAALSASERFGVQMRDHRSKPLTHDMVQDADAIIVMEISQLKSLRKTFPSHKEKIYPLSLFASRSQDYAWGYRRFNIQDPYGKSEKDFINCYRQISRCLDGLVTNDYSS